MHPVLFTFSYCASGPNPGEKEMTPINEYPCQANCWVNSRHINKKINSIKFSVVLSQLCPSLAVCPMPEATREPPKQTMAVPKNSQNQMASLSSICLW